MIYSSHQEYFPLYNLKESDLFCSEFKKIPFNLFTTSDSTERGLSESEVSAIEGRFYFIGLFFKTEALLTPF